MVEFTEYQNAILGYALNYHDIMLIITVAIGFLSGTILAHGFGNQIFKI